MPLVEQELLTLPGHLSSPSVFSRGSCYSIFSFMCMFCRSLFVFLYFFFLPLCFLFLLDIQILITHLISSNSASYIGLLLKIDSECRISTKETISIFLLLTFHMYVATFHQHLHIEYISLSWFQSLRFLIWFPLYMVAAKRETTESRVPSG